MECYTYLRNVTDPLSDGEDSIRKTFWKTIWRTDYSIWFTGWVAPCNCERPVKNPSSGKESLTWIVPRIRFVRGENLEGWRTGCRSWGFGNEDASEHLLKKTLCERGDISHRKKENLFFQSQMDESIPLEEIRTWEHPPWYGNDQFKEKVMLIFLENQKGLFYHLKTHFGMPVKQINDFWSMSGNFINHCHVEPKVKLYSPKEESFPIPLKYIDVSRTAHTNLDVKQEKRIDLSDPWTSFTQFTRLDEKPPEREQLTSRPDCLWPELWGKMERIPNWTRRKSGHMEDKEVKETIKNARKKLETPMAHCHALQDKQDM